VAIEMTDNRTSAFRSQIQGQEFRLCHVASLQSHDDVSPYPACRSKELACTVYQISTERSTAPALALSCVWWYPVR
jgi:hypothetical protein